MKNVVVEWPRASRPAGFDFHFLTWLFHSPQEPGF
jgi:hypothetical protein